MRKRKIHAVTVTVYVEQSGRQALPKRSEIAEALVRSLENEQVDVQYSGDSFGVPLTQTMSIIGVYSNLSTRPVDQKGPDLKELREQS